MITNNIPIDKYKDLLITDNRNISIRNIIPKEINIEAKTVNARTRVMPTSEIAPPVVVARLTRKIVLYGASLNLMRQINTQSKNGNRNNLLICG